MLLKFESLIMITTVRSTKPTVHSAKPTVHSLGRFLDSYYINIVISYNEFLYKLPRYEANLHEHPEDVIKIVTGINMFHAGFAKYSQDTGRR